MIAPKSPGHRVRELFVEGGGTPALVAVEQDASGKALAQALSYGKGIGTTRAGVLVTTFKEETETDLFGEQAVLCGGVSALVKAGFKTLVDAGYQPEVAYFECLHELKLIVDLIYRGGLNYMRYSVSDTAEYGDYTAGPRVIGPEARAEMQKLLAEIQDGTFAKKWIKENEDGRPWFNKTRAAEQTQILEEVGAKLRALMPFIQPVTDPAGRAGRVAAIDGLDRLTNDRVTQLTGASALNSWPATLSIVQSCHRQLTARSAVADRPPRPASSVHPGCSCRSRETRPGPARRPAVVRTCSRSSRSTRGDVPAAGAVDRDAQQRLPAQRRDEQLVPERRDRRAASRTPRLTAPPTA